MSRTANPLVALYSAPACAKGTLVVQFRPAAGGAWQSTAPQPCGGGTSINVLVAGMRPSTSYVLRHVVAGGAPSTPLNFTTGKPPTDLKITTFTVGQAPTAQADPTSQVIFHALIPNFPPKVANPIGTDLSGHLVWYYDTLRSGLTNIWPVHSLPGGTALILGKDKYDPKGDNVLREIDLAGDTVRETNIDVVDAQLSRRGQEPIYMFHHDAIRLPNGDTAVLGATQKKFNGQDVMSDMAVVLDSNLQVVWTWDMFNHFTPPATFPASSGTRSVLGALPDPKSHDWTHGNALDYSAQDGDLLISFRNISTVLKVNYQHGHGDGNVVWRLGKGGDFTIKSSDP
ncbi:MAG: aryl-sulfate sulfotransferase, partial [Chloroflexota bacterium]